MDADGKTIGHLYFGAMKRSNRLMRFLSPSKPAFIANLSTGKVKLGDGHSAIVGRYIGGAFRHDLGQSLKINGEEVLSDENAGRTLVTVGLFLSDQNENKKTELGAAWTASFLVGSDVFMDASKPGFIEVEWNGEKMSVPNWPSSEGMLSVMLY